MPDPITNREFAKVAHFQRACERAGVQPTKRQASKFRRGKGRAFTARREENA